jgi:hypothetical protein
MTDIQSISMEEIIKRNSDLMTTEIDGELVLLSIENGKYYSLNGIGTKIWKLIENPIPVLEVCRKLMSEFEVDSKRCEYEVQAFLSELISASLVSRCEQNCVN